MLDFAEISLVVVCLSVSLLNATVGTTGGLTFAAMATLLPIGAVIPIHGIVEASAALFRWHLMRRYVDFDFLVAFTIGGAAGFFVGWPLVGLFSVDALKVLLGAFILIIAWAPLSKTKVSHSRYSSLSGGITSCLTVLVGATGALVAAIIARNQIDHRHVIGTHAACMTFQHGGKVLLFGVSGFTFVKFSGLISALILAIIIGTWLGKRILIRTPQQVLSWGLKVIVTVLGGRLLVQGLFAIV